ncbi:MAG: AAA family ATPase [Methylococcaceae bacterium]|nr:AAA family ATPase [Methylococcaceae bacterium]
MLEKMRGGEKAQEENIEYVRKLAEGLLKKFYSQQAQGPNLVNPASNIGTTTEANTESPFKRVSIADVLSSPSEPQRYIWGERIPFEVLTLLAAHGGTGKSLFGLQLGAHVAVAKPFLGLPTDQVKTLYFSAEDSTCTIRRRMAGICRADELNPDEVAKNLIVLDATDAPCLFDELSIGGVRKGTITKHYSELKAMIEFENVGFLIVDNASDTFGANPIDRQAVTQFIRALVQLVRGKGGAVLLLAHVNKVTSRNGKNQTDTEGYADSAAWHNAARSRLFLNSTNDECCTLSLTHQKNNYGKKQSEIKMAFRDNGSSLFVTDAAYITQTEVSRDFLRLSKRVPLLKLIHEFYLREEWISPSTNSATTNAHALLKAEDNYPFDKVKVAKMNALLFCATVSVII